MRPPAFLGLLLLAAGAASAAEPIRIAVYHTNDVHGWFMSRDVPAGSTATMRRGGGMAALASLVRREPGPKLLLDAGDWFQGTPEGTLTKGLAAVEYMNALGYDAAVIGNHEFDFAEKRLKDLVALLRVPALGANVYEYKTQRRVSYLKPSIIKTVRGVKVGIFGLLTTRMGSLTFPKNFEGLYFRREVDEAREQVQRLRDRGATVVIALTHVGLEEPRMAPFEGDRYLAANVPGIDLIVGGHSHTVLREPVRDPKNGTLIVQAGAHLTRAGRAVLEIDPATKRVTGSSGELLDLWTQETAEAQDILRITDKYREEVGKALDVVVGTAAGTLTRNRWGESSLGSWMADCYLEWAKTDLAFQNGGGIRSDLPQGPVTLRRLFEVMPFDNHLVTLSLTGEQVRRLLEHGVSGSHGVLQMGGVRLRYSGSREPGQKVSEAWVGESPLQPSRVYTTASVDFMLDGGDGYSILGEGKDIVRTDTLLRDILGWCAHQRPVDPPASGRMDRT